ncbi:MAG: histidine phosphatase family protein [Candidatus Hermodarchaeota archaeon]
MRIIFIRHGETDSVRKYIWNGTNDSQRPLNKTGIMQINQLIPFLKNYRPEIIYTSPLYRAIHTTQILQEEFNVESVLEKNLSETHFGDWEGLSMDEINQKYQSDFKQWMENPTIFSPPKSEPLNNLISRVKSFIDNLIITNKTKNKDYFVVTHGGPIRAMIIDLLNIDLSLYWRIQIPHGSATCFEFKNDLIQLKYMGQIAIN